MTYSFFTYVVRNWGGYPWDMRALKHPTGVNRRLIHVVTMTLHVYCFDRSGFVLQKACIRVQYLHRMVQKWIRFGELTLGFVMFFVHYALRSRHMYSYWWIHIEELILRERYDITIDVVTVIEKGTLRWLRNMNL